MLKWYLIDGVFVWKEKYQNEKKNEKKYLDSEILNIQKLKKELFI